MTLSGMEACRHLLLATRSARWNAILSLEATLKAGRCKRTTDARFVRTAALFSSDVRRHDSETAAGASFAFPGTLSVNTSSQDR